MKEDIDNLSPTNIKGDHYLFGAGYPL